MSVVTKHKILSQLKDDMSFLSSKMQLVAKYIVDHPADFGLDPIRVTAEKAGVSTNTLVRMSEVLGFEGFYELREPFRQSLLTSSESIDDFDWVDALAQQSPIKKRMAEVSRNTLAVTHQSLRKQQPDDLLAMVDTLLSSDAIYVTGYRASYGLAYYFYYVCRMALPNLHLIPGQANSATDELINVSNKDTLIAITSSPYSREAIEICQFAQGKGAKLFLITDSAIVAPSLDIDDAQTFVASTHTTHHFACHTGALALLETIIAMVVHQGGTETKKRIAAYDEIRKESNAYWSKQKS